MLTLQAGATTDGQCLLVVQAFPDRTLRGLARWGETAGLPDELPLAGLCGHGTLVISIETGGAREPYQGIVPLDGESIAAAPRNWFAQSEQLPTRLVLAADAARGWPALRSACPASMPPITGSGSRSRRDFDGGRTAVGSTGNPAAPAVFTGRT